MKQLVSTILLLCILKTSFSQKTDTLTIHFEFDKSDLTTIARSELNDLIKKIDPLTTSIELNGHTDSKGSNAYNDALALKRVTVVKEFLENNHVKTDIIIAKSFGKTRLLSLDSTETANYDNRRVEIRLIRPEIVKEEKKSLTTMLTDSALKKGDVIAIPNLEFVNNSDIILQRSMPVLEDLLRILDEHPSMKISIEGHICCTPFTKGLAMEGQPSFRISLIRAKMVYDYLLKNNIEPSRLSYAGFGNSHPIYAFPEKNEDERMMNRRVEIRIIEK